MNFDFIADLLIALQEFTAGLPDPLTWLGVVLASAIPFVESYLGSILGLVAGLPMPLAVALAIAGNAASMTVLVLGTSAVRERAASRREAGGVAVADAGPQTAPSKRRAKLRRLFDRYGVAGVSLFGQTVLPSQITASAMVGFGAPRRTVIAWQLVSITLWGVAFGVMATYGLGWFAA